MTARAATPFSPTMLAERLGDAVAADRLVIGLSGGADSAALLAAAANLASTYAVRAVHIDHGLPGSPRLRAAAQSAAAHCGIPLQIIAVELQNIPALGVEAAARDARYAAFKSTLQPGEDLLTAHHVEDQAETLLLQLLRGAGARGLAAMPVMSALGSGRLVRPLLNVGRDALRAYAVAMAVPWCEDPSNDDRDLDRNYLRHEIWPALCARWPSAGVTLGRSAGHLAETVRLLDTELEQRLAEAAAGDGLRLSALQAMEPAWRREVVRSWLRGRGLSVPSTRRLAQLEAQFFNSNADTQPLLAWGGWELRRHDGRLVVHQSLPPLALPAQAALRVGEAVDLAGLGRLVVESGGVGNLRLRSTGEYRLAVRQGGERWQSDPNRPMRPLKDCLREARIPPWVRERVVLVWAGEAVAAVVLPHQAWVAAAHQARGAEDAMVLRWINPPDALLGPLLR